MTELAENGERSKRSERPLAVALSGGGYRASLLAIGALIALVDRRLNARVEVISSVSGGSITNAVVAHAGDYRTLAPGELDSCATSLVRALRKHSVFQTKASLWVMVGSPVLMALLYADFFGGWLVALALAIVVSATMLLVSTGRVFTQQLSAVFDLEHATLGGIADHATTHEFCATDLVTGMPLTFSSRGSRVRRRLPETSGGHRTVEVEEPRWGLAALIRASAAFPGIPPMSFKFPHDETARGLSRRALCADGGIWNNLGTQAIDGEPGRRELSVICVNASSLAKPMAPGWCFIPGVALVVAVARSMNILNRNTVEPRVEAINRDLDRWAEGRLAGGPADPITVVADMRPIAAAVQLVRALPMDVGLDRLVSSPWWISLSSADSTSEIRTKTKLTRVASQEARALLLRGYTNTYLASLTFDSFATSEIENVEVASILGRIDTILAEKKRLGLAARVRMRG